MRDKNEIIQEIRDELVYLYSRVPAIENCSVEYKRAMDLLWVLEDSKKPGEKK